MDIDKTILRIMLLCPKREKATHIFLEAEDADRVIKAVEELEKTILGDNYFNFKSSTDETKNNISKVKLN